jgi:sugar phosphate isomerase/epimerase
MVKISALPRCWINEISEGQIDLFDWIEMSSKLDCDGLEMYFRFFKSHSSKYLEKIKKKVESLGMSIPTICYSPDFIQYEQEDRKKEIDKQIEMIKITAELGGKYCRTLSGQGRPGISVEDGIKWVVDSIERCLQAAQENNICIVIENHYKDGYWLYKEFAQKKEVFLAIVNKIDSANFGVQYDPSNAVVAGDDPLDILDHVIAKVRTMHASDRYLADGATIEDMRQEDGTLGYPEYLIHGIIGQGLNDYDAIFSRLYRAKFDGWVSIEDGMNGFEEMKQSIDFLKIMIGKYYGK